MLARVEIILTRKSPAIAAPPKLGIT